MERAWWKESIVYQIYPRSFYDSNGDGIGDIQGIISKLDYLSDLGVDILWICPMYKSPNTDNGYDISDYKEIMTDFGTMEDFDELLEKAHKRNIKIVMDLVVNHTSDEHPWFIESRKSKDNPYRDYYIWREGKEDNPPNNWGSWFGGPAWEYDKTTDMYYLHIFSKKQPDLNWDNPKVREEVFDMMKWWLDKGVDGFRMDVISLISKHPDLPDGEVQDGIYGNLSPYCINGPHVHDYLKEMYGKVLSKYDIMTVGEATGVTIDEAVKYAGYNSKELHSVFQFEHVDIQDEKYGKWTDKKVPLKHIKEVFIKWQTQLEGKAWNCLFWSNHDQPRAVSRFGDDSEMYHSLSAKMLATCLHMMKGTPYIYQGEEIGMTNANFEDLNEYRDLETFNAYDKLIHHLGVKHDTMMKYLKCISRDNARTPMQWNSSKNAGFTTGTPWIRVNDNYDKINVENQKNDPLSIYNYYKKLIQLRHNYDIIVYGTFVPLLEDSEKIFAYKRRLGNNRLYVFCNFTKDKQLYEAPEELLLSNPRTLISNYDTNVIGLLKPYEAVVYLI